MSYRRTYEKIEAIIKLGEELGLDKSLTGHFENGDAIPGLCITEKQVRDMASIIEWANLEYGLAYSVIIDTEKDYGKDPESDLYKMWNAVDTIRDYTDRYNIPELNQTGIIEDLEQAVRHLKPVENKQMKIYIGEVRKALEQRLDEYEYKNKKRLLDGLMNTFKKKGKDF